MSDYYRKIAKSSSYNLLTVYLTFIFGILNTFIIARLLAPKEWALIIITLSFINTAIFFCKIFPPNAQDSIKYYIPHLDSEKEDTYEIKRRFIFHIYKIRLNALFVIFVVYLITVYMLHLTEILFKVIIIMAFMIVFIVIINLNNSILLAFQKFKIVFFITILNPIIYTTGNIFVFLLRLENPLFLVAYAYLAGSTISCVFSIIVFIFIMPVKKKKQIGLKIEFRKIFYQIHRKYGLNLILAELFSLLSSLIINFIFLITDNLEYITFVTICQISVISALGFSSSNPDSYVSIFSEIDYKKNPKEFFNNYNNLSIFLMIFNCIIIAIMQFFIIIYIAIIYSKNYLIIITFIQLYLFSAFAKMIINNFYILTLSTNHTKINAEITLIEMITQVIITMIALLFFDFYFLILLYVVNSFILTFVMFYLIKRSIINDDLKLLNYFKPFLAFSIGFIVINVISLFLNFKIFDKEYMNIILAGMIKIVIFLGILYFIIYTTHLISKEEFIKLVKIIPILNSKNYIIRIIVKIIEKTLPSERFSKKA